MDYCIKCKEEKKNTSFFFLLTPTEQCTEKNMAK